MPTIVTEIWISMAHLAKRAGDIRLCVQQRELRSRIDELFGDTRPGVAIHVSQHAVAQRPLNTGYNRCYLSSAPDNHGGSRRLFLPDDKIHESRLHNPKKIPRKDEVPERFQHLLEWYKKQVDGSREFDHPDGKAHAFSDTETAQSDSAPDENRDTLSGFATNFEHAYNNFYQNTEASYRYFRKGPCIHFHRKAITIWKDNIVQGKNKYKSLLLGNEYAEAIYSTLTAWGMNRLGGGPKLKDYDLFKDNLLSLADHLEKIKHLNIMAIKQKKDIVREIYSLLDPTENEMDLVAKSKTLHHLHPEVFPPVDRQYTLNIFRRLEGLKPRPALQNVGFGNYWDILCCFQVLIDKVGEERVRSFVGREIMDTSFTKVMDNAIIGFSNLP